MTSGGDPAKLDKEKSVLRNSVIGLIIIFASYSITVFILRALLGGGAGLPPGVSEPPIGFERLSGSLGAGIISDHYPPRFGTDIPRNTKIIITFKEPIAVASLSGNQIQGADTPDDQSDDAWELNSDNVRIFKTRDTDSARLVANKVQVRATVDKKIWVFDPVDLLGDGLENINYTVVLSPDINKADGSDAFTGLFSQGYEWTFTVSTVIDLTPPKVSSYAPPNASTPDRNIVIQINFNEAIDPTSASGIYKPADGNTFSKVSAKVGDNIIEGVWNIVNGYRTIEFVTFDQCGEDPCGGAIFCLPASSDIDVRALAATVDAQNAPQALNFPYDGVVDVASNSLDGDDDGRAEGPTVDDKAWGFNTTAVVNDTVPEISSIVPNILESNISLDVSVNIGFSTPMMASTLTSANMSLTPAPTHEMWFLPRSVNFYENPAGSSTFSETPPTQSAPAAFTRADILHGLFFESVGASRYDYSADITDGVKSNYQICYSPAIGPGRSDNSDACASLPDGTPSCCNGTPSVSCP